MPCPDDLPPLPSHDLAQQVIAAPPDMRYVYIAIATLAVVALLLDYWLTKKHQPSMSNGIRKGPRWFRWFSIGALVALAWHLFFQGKGKAEVKP